MMLSKGYRSRFPVPARDPYTLGAAAFARGDFARALPRLLEAIAREPFWVPAYVLLGQLYLALGDEEAGEAYLLSARSMDPGLSFRAASA